MLEVGATYVNVGPHANEVTVTAITETGYDITGKGMPAKVILFGCECYWVKKDA